MEDSPANFFKAICRGRGFFQFEFEDVRNVVGASPGESDHENAIHLVHHKIDILIRGIIPVGPVRPVRFACLPRFAQPELAGGVTQRFAVGGVDVDRRRIPCGNE